MGNKHKQKNTKKPYLYDKKVKTEAKETIIEKPKEQIKMNVLDKNVPFKIVYLTPNTTYRTHLRSDTLWGHICWAIANVYGKDKVEEFITKQPFFVSSTFPFLQDEKDNKIEFFPKPFSNEDKEKIKDELSYLEKLDEMTKQKKEKKATSWLSKSDFEEYINGKKYINSEKLEKENISITQKSTAVTRNRIDRILGGTLKIGGAGQLFHIEEHYFEQEKAGLFFLVQGTDFSLLEGALRYLNHAGFGGDRSTGKGNFEISEIQDFVFKVPTKSDFMLNLSLYHPTDTELDILQASENPNFVYQLEDRKGKLGFLNYKNVEKDAFLFFKEGSIFPYFEAESYGYNPEVQNVKTLNLPHKVYQYGRGFMLNINLKTQK